MKPTSLRAFSLIEILIGVVIVCALAAFYLSSSSTKVSITQPAQGIDAVFHTRQIHLAIQAMNMDHATRGETSLLYDPTLTVEKLTNALVTGGYLSEPELRRALSVTDKNSGQTTENAWRFFALAESDPADTLFMATKNWQGIASTHLEGEPFGDKGFAVMRAGGDGAFLPASARNDAKAVGSGGRFNYLPLK